MMNSKVLQIVISFTVGFLVLLVINYLLFDKWRFLESGISSFILSLVTFFIQSSMKSKK